MKKIIFLLTVSAGILIGAEYRAPMMSAPVIDGKVSPGEWEKAAKYDHFSLFGRKVQGSHRLKTTALIGRDADHLYFAVICQQPAGVPPKCAEKRADGPIHKEDIVEVFLDASILDTQYYQLASNAAGTRFDALVGGTSASVDSKWSSPLWKNAAGIDASGYTVEFSVPLKMLRFDKEGKIRFNITRTVRSDGNAYITLAPMSGDGWHQPEKFAILNTGNTAPYSLLTFQESPGNQNVLLGKNTFQLEVFNHADLPAGAKIILNTPGKQQTRSVELPKGAFQMYFIPWDCLENKGFYQWKLVDKNGKTLHESATFRYHIDGGYCFVEPVSFAGKNPLCRIRLTYAQEILKKTIVKFRTTDQNGKVRSFSRPYAPLLLLEKHKPGSYLLDVEVVHDKKQHLFRKKCDFLVVENIL